MLNIDLTAATFDLVTTLGSADTNNPPPVLFRFWRPGTNYQSEVLLAEQDMVTGDGFVQYVDQKTDAIEQTGQYRYELINEDDMSILETGIMIVTGEPIIKKQYGTDKQRGEYKGHN